LKLSFQKLIAIVCLCSRASVQFISAFITECSSYRLVLQNLELMENCYFFWEILINNITISGYEKKFAYFHKIFLIIC
jgi:hypothetical protein